MPRIEVSRNTFLVAGIAAVVAFLTLVVIGRLGDRTRSQSRETPTAEKRITVVPPRQGPIARPTPAALAVFDRWTPPPTEIVRLTSAVTVYNARGKEVKQFPVGKRLKVSMRAGEQFTIDYLGDHYTIPTASTEPSQ